MNDPLFLDKCYFDFEKFCNELVGPTISPDFRLKDFHVEWADIVSRHRFSMIEAPRQHGKSMVLGILYPIWLTFYHEKRNVLITASEEGQAIKILEDIKTLIENNDILRELKPDNPETWGKKGIKLNNGSKLYAKAFTTKIKGLSLHYVFVDEVQDITDRQVYWKGIEPTVSHTKGTICCVGVPDNPGDMVEELAGNSDYFHKKYPAIIKGKPIWPEKFSIEELNSIRKRIGEEAFQTQFMLNPKVGNDKAVFPHDWIYNCLDKNKRFGLPESENSCVVIGADFAMSSADRADFDCYVVVERYSGKVTILHGELHKGEHVESKKERIRNLFKKYRANFCIVDPSNVGSTIYKDLLSEGYPVLEGPFYARERKQMLVNLQMIMQPDKHGKSVLVIPANPSDPETKHFAERLVDELIGFRKSKTKTNVETYLSTAKHDDTVAALILACKVTSDQKEFVDMVAI